MRVVIAPATGATDAVHDCLRSWSGAGLLEAFCLWRVPVDSPPQDARGVVLVDSGADRVGTLPEMLQDTPSDRVSLLGFYATGDEEGFDPRFSARVTECMRLAANVLAYDKMRPIECTMIVAPGRTGQPVPPDVFCGTWNLYVAPEDHSTPTAPNQLPDSNGFLPRHGAHALATVADLWVDSVARPSGVLEAVAAEDVYAIDPPAVRLVRCFSRVVDFGYVADHVAAGVFQAGEEWSNPDPDHFDRVSDPTRLVKHAVREFMKVHHEAIGLTEFEPLRLPPEARPSLLEALRELIGIIIARIRRIPSDLTDATLGAAHDRLADRIDKLRGPDAPRTLRWRERPEADRNLTDIADQLGAPVAIPDGSTGAAWHDLRQLAFALVDGAELPAGIDASSFSRSGKRPLVTRPAALVPDPLQLPPGNPVERACDPLRLDPHFSEAADEQQEEAETPANAEALEAWLEGRRQAMLWGVGHEIAAALKVARAAAAELDSQADADAEEQDSPGAESEKEAGSFEQEPTAGPTSGKESRWRRLRNRLLINTGATLVASALAWTQLDLAAALGVQALIGVAWTLGFFGLALSFVRLERAILRQEIEAELETVNAAMRRALYAGDEPRLERRYAEYLDWAEIIGWMVHQPWVGEPIERVELREAIAQSTLPAACRVGVARIPESTLERLCGQARAKVFQARWLTSQYRSVADEAMARVALSYSYSGAGGLPDPDTDSLDDPDSPRRQLLAAIRRGDGRHLRNNEMTGEVLRFIDRVPLDASTDEVRSPQVGQATSNGADGLPNPLPPCAAWFAPPASLPDLAPRILGRVIRVAVNSPSGPRVGLGALLSADGLAVTSLSVVEGASSLRIRLADDSQCEAALVAALADADLALLRLEDPALIVEEPLAFGAAETLLGEAVIVPSPPGGEPGQPEVALGLVTSRSSRRSGRLGTEFSLFGATYRTAAGPAGAPVFNLEGQIVGIHSSKTLDDGDSDLGATRTVIEASAINALLTAEASSDSEGAAAPIGGPVPRLVKPVASGAQAALVTSKPSKFIGDLFPAASGPVGLLPQHWLDPDDQHLTEMVRARPDLDSADLSSLSTGAQFMQPLRILAHRVDMTQAVAARELASCPVEAPDPDPEMR